jgi:hypothetical protein
MWCLVHNVICWPVWLPRTHTIIKVADERSRLRIPHDQRSPQVLVDLCNSLAVKWWGTQISFDQMASHRSAITIDGKSLPFNAFCAQPGASGVDTFAQWKSWRDNINYALPPQPMLGRLVSFLPSTKSRSIIAFPTPTGVPWWSYATSPNAKGVLESCTLNGYSIVVFDFSTMCRTSAGPPRP